MLQPLKKLLFFAVCLPASFAGAQGIPPGDWAGKALAQALVVSAQIEDPYRRAQAFADIGNAQLKAGEIAAGRETLSLALATSGNISVEALKSWVVRDIAVAQIKALEDPADILALVERIREPRARDSALAALARGLKSREPAAAVTAARRIRDTAQQGRVLWEIAVTQAERGYPEDGLATARSIVNSSMNALALGDMAAAYAAQGDLQQARLLAGRIRNNLYRARASGRIAAAQAGRGDTQGALAAATGIEHKLTQAQTLAAIAAVRADRGDVAGAREVLDAALSTVRSERRGGDAKAVALAQIARAQLNIADTQAVRQTLSELITVARGSRGQQPAVDLIDDLARLQAKAGDYSAARTTAAEVGDATVRALLIRDIIAEQARKGDIAGALVAARQLEADHSAALAVAAIVAVQAAANEPGALRETIDSVLPIVRRINTASVRSGALAFMASALAKEQDLSAAEQIFAEAMSAASAASEKPLQAAAFVQIADNLGYGLD